jgi:hypothetical protein
MAASKNAPATTPAERDEVDDLFDQADKASRDDEFADVDDLLDEVEEDDSEGWVPTEAGQGIVGKVIKVGVTRSDFAADGEDPNVPTVTLELKDGTKYRIIGYSSVLKRELTDQNPQVDDFMAVKYFGEKKLKTGKFAGRPYKHFGVNVRRARTA